MRVNRQKMVEFLVQLILNNDLSFVYVAKKKQMAENIHYLYTFPFKFIFHHVIEVITDDKKRFLYQWISIKLSFKTCTYNVWQGQGRGAQHYQRRRATDGKGYLKLNIRNDMVKKLNNGCGKDILKS